MISKSTQLGCKLKIVTTLYLLLAVTVIAQSNEEASEVKPFAEYDLSLTDDQPQFYTDMLYADRGIIVTTQILKPQLLQALHLRPIGFWIRLISPEPNSTTIGECYQSLNAEAINSIKRLSYKVVLFEAPSMNEKTHRKLVLLNIKNCNYASVYDGPLPFHYKIFTSGNASDESFTLLMHGKTHCRGHNWCRLFFNPFYYKFEPLNFDFPTNGFYNIQPATSFDGNHFVVDLFDESLDKYMKRLYFTENSTESNYKELLSFENNMSASFNWSQIELISSPLSYCWRTNKSTDEDKIIHCAAFLEDGTILFNKTIAYSDVLRFYKVQSIPNGLILIGKRECTNKDKCSNVQTTVITNDSCFNSSCSTSTPQRNQLITVRHRYYNFTCRPLFVSRMYFRVKVSNDSLEVDHTCIYENRTDFQNSRSYVIRV